MAKPFSLLLSIALLLAAVTAFGHEIPADVTIHVFVKPEGSRLRLIARVPIAALRDVDYPKGKDVGDLDLSKADFALRNGAQLWLANNIEVYEEGRLLPAPAIVEVRASIMSDRSMSSYEEALAHVTGPPLPPDTLFPWNQGLLDVLFEYPIQSDHSKFSLRPYFARLGLRTVTVLRFISTDGGVHAWEFNGDPGMVHLDPRWHQAALQFVKLGFLHILDGTDHLLFLFCLVIPFRRFRQLLLVITSFTVAHSVTLIASAYNFAPSALWFPPLVETLIATSIFYMAMENIVGSQLGRRWLITFGFGLIHGFGFSFALRETLQFAGSHMLMSLLSFNVGVELGQLLVLALLIPALDVLFKRVVAERMGTIILSTVAAHTAWHWMAERWEVLRQFHLEWPQVTTALLAEIVRWLMFGVLISLLVFLIGVFRQRLNRGMENKAVIDLKE